MSSGASMNPYKAAAWHAESFRPEESLGTFAALSNDLWRQAWGALKAKEPSLAENYRDRLPRSLALLDGPQRLPGAAKDEIYTY